MNGVITYNDQMRLKIKIMEHERYFKYQNRLKITFDLVPFCSCKRF